MTVTAADGSSLLIDGSDGLYFILLQRPDGSQFQPFDPTQPEEFVTILCGGVTTTLPRPCLLDQSAVLRVVQQFQAGLLDTSSGWEPL